MKQQTEPPPGYTLEFDEHAVLVFVRREGRIIRRENRQPVSFRYADEAIRFAWWHHDGEKLPTMRLPGQQK